MKKVIGGILFLVSVFFLSKTVFAASYSLDFVPYRLPESCDLEVDGGQVCFEKYLAGEVEDSKTVDGTVKPGDVIMLIVQLTPSEDSIISGIKATIGFDSNKVVYQKSSFGLEYGELDNELGAGYNIYPTYKLMNKPKTDWKATVSLRENEVMIISFDKNKRLPLNKTTPFCALYFQVKENAISEILFNFQQDSFKTSAADNQLKTNGISNDLVFNSLTLQVDTNEMNFMPYFSSSKIENQYSYEPNFMTNKKNTSNEESNHVSQNLTNEPVKLGIGEQKEIELSNYDVQWVSKNGNVVSVENGVVTGIDYGETEVQMIVTIPVKVEKRISVSGTGTLNIYREPELSYIATVANIKLSDFIRQFESNHELHVYDISDNEVTDSDTLMGTGMKLKMIVDGVVQDELTIIVKGDLDGDGYILMTDYLNLQNILYEKKDATILEQKAGDVADHDGVITISDFMRLSSCMLFQISAEDLL